MFITQRQLGSPADSEKKRSFARAKQDLPNKCLICKHLGICRGGCLKDRVGFPDGSFLKMKAIFVQAIKSFLIMQCPNSISLQLSSAATNCSEQSCSVNNQYFVKYKLIS